MHPCVNYHLLIPSLKIAIRKKYLNLSGKNGNNTFQNLENLQISKMYVAKILHPKTTEPAYATHVT